MTSEKYIDTKTFTISDVYQMGMHLLCTERTQIGVI